MKRKDLTNTECPISRSLERVGEWWSILILRDALTGIARFDDFQASLGIAPNMLTRRLNALVADGMLERSQYCEKPPRFEYLPTARGRDFQPVLQALMVWGNRHFAESGRSVTIRNLETGLEAEPILIDSVSGRPLSDPVFVMTAGPAASDAVKRRYGISIKLAKVLPAD